MFVNFFKMSKKVLDDKNVPGGEWRREIDANLSKNYGGYKSDQVRNGGKPSAYGKYLEPILHAGEHTLRACYDQNGKKFARAIDELETFGVGLQSMERNYQKREYDNNK